MTAEIPFHQRYSLLACQHLRRSWRINAMNFIGQKQNHPLYDFERRAEIIFGNRLLILEFRCFLSDRLLVTEIVLKCGIANWNVLAES